MFSLVALMCLYLGTNNISKAFNRPFGSWQAINWMLAVSGLMLILVGIACIWQAIRDYTRRGKEKQAKEEAEKKARQRQFFYDEEDTDYADTDGDSGSPSPEDE